MSGSECSSTGTVEAEIETVNMVAYLPISEERLNTICSATQTNKTLQTLKDTIQRGWPKNEKDTLRDIMHYYSFQEELSVQDGIIFRGERAVIPYSLQKDIIHRIHSSQLGVESCLRRARE